MAKQRVRFTDVVDKTFGGTYSTAEYSARAEDELVLEDTEVRRLMSHHKGLVKIVESRVKDEIAVSE